MQKNIFMPEKRYLLKKKSLLKKKVLFKKKALLLCKIVQEKFLED